MIPMFHLMLFCLSLARTEILHKETSDDFVYDQVARKHRDWRFNRQSDDAIQGGPALPRHSTYHEQGREGTGSEVKRMLLRSDLGKRYYDDIPYPQAMVDISSDEVASTIETSSQGDYENDYPKRSNEHVLKLWHLKEGWRKRPMLRGDLGKRQMIRSDLG